MICNAFLIIHTTKSALLSFPAITFALSKLTHTYTQTEKALKYCSVVSSILKSSSVVSTL